MHTHLQRLSLFAALQFFVATCFAAVPVSPQVKIVAALYRDFAYEAVLEEPSTQSPVLVEQPRQVLLRYFTPKLVELLLQDRRCVSTSHEICRLDFMPLWGNQDPFGTAVQVLQGSTAEIVNVRLRYPSSAHLLTYHLTQANGEWRIQDISYGDGRSSLAEILGSKQ